MYLNEFKKAVRFIPMWGCLVFCFFFNLILTFNVVGVDEFNDFSSSLVEGTATVKTESVFSSYDVDRELTSRYTDIVSGSPMAVNMRRGKYAGVQSHVDHLALEGADSDVMAGIYTPLMYKELFKSFLPALTAEACVMGMLLTIHLLSYETSTKTYLFMSCTRVGRKIDICKIMTALISSLIFYVVLGGTSLLIYFSHWNYSGIWDSSMSSVFNQISDLGILKPFITMGDFTVRSYVLFTMLLGTVLVIVSVLFASVIGLIVKKTYVAGILSLLIPASGLFLSVILSSAEMWGGYLISMLLPINIWVSQPVWFTEGGLSSPCLWFETKGLIGALVAFTLLMACTVKTMHRRDIA